MHPSDNKASLSRISAASSFPGPDSAILLISFLSFKLSLTDVRAKAFWHQQLAEEFLVMCLCGVSFLYIKSKRCLLRWWYAVLLSPAGFHLNDACERRRRWLLLLLLWLSELFLEGLWRNLFFYQCRWSDVDSLGPHLHCKCCTNKRSSQDFTSTIYIDPPQHYDQRRPN